MFGYVAEFLLKSAYYQVRHVPLNVDLREELRGIPVRAKFLGFPWKGNLHNLESIANLLIAERRLRGNPLDAGVEVELLDKIQFISKIWSESLRYKSEPVGSDELHDVFSTVEWLRDRYTILRGNENVN